MSKTDESRCTGRFCQEEDRHLLDLVQKFGEHSWQTIALHMSGRTLRQCKERWTHYLSPHIKVTSWTQAEDQLLERQVCRHGNKWKQLETFFPGRTDTQLKNRFNLLQRRRERLRKIKNLEPLRNNHKTENLLLHAEKQEEKTDESTLFHWMTNETHFDDYEVLEWYNVDFQNKF
jgi:hypothetical protein